MEGLHRDVGVGIIEVVGVASIGGIPGPQMAEMRASVREHVQVPRGAVGGVLEVAAYAAITAVACAAVVAATGLTVLTGGLGGKIQLALIDGQVELFFFVEPFQHDGFGATLSAQVGDEPVELGCGALRR